MAIHYRPMPNFLRNFGSTLCSKVRKSVPNLDGKAKKTFFESLFFQIQGLFLSMNEETISNLFFKYSPLCLFGHGPYINSNSV